jgi:hypothetical protein
MFKESAMNQFENEMLGLMQFHPNYPEQNRPERDPAPDLQSNGLFKRLSLLLTALMNLLAR